MFIFRMFSVAALPVVLSVASSLAFGAELPSAFTGVQNSRAFDNANADATLGKPMPARVRLPVKLVTFKTVVATDREGKTRPSFIPNGGIVRTIRSRIDKPNHFFIGDKGEWHIESVPMRFSKTDKRYTARLNISKQIGVDGAVEEQIGSIEVAGVLVQEEAGLYNFVTNSRQQFRDKMGNPILELSVGLGATNPTNNAKSNPAPAVASDAQQKL